jgi:hypothetical protein
VLGSRAAQALKVVFEGTLPAARMRFGGTAPAAAPPLPQLLDTRATDTNALGNRARRVCAGFQRLDDSVPKVLRGWFHTRYSTENVPYSQLQPALGVAELTATA